MKYLKPVDGKITSRWDDPRPLSNPGQHIHGAIDISLYVGAPIKAPADGEVSYFMLLRNTIGELWYDELRIGLILPWPYFYDLYGGVIVLRDKYGKVHLLTHIYFNQLFEKSNIPKHAWSFQEESKQDRFPNMIFHTFGYRMPVQQGDVIGHVGNAGYSTGAHVHWEIHDGWTYTKYEDRIDPEENLE